MEKIEFYQESDKRKFDRLIDYTVFAQAVSIMCKNKYYRDAIFTKSYGIKYDIFMPLKFRDNLLINFKDLLLIHNVSNKYIQPINQTIISNTKNGNNGNNNSKNNNEINISNFINSIKFEQKLEYLNIYGINNIFGIDTTTKLILLDLIFIILYIPDKDIKKKCQFMDKINLLLNSTFYNDTYNIEANLSIAKGYSGTINYIDINNKVIKKQKYKNNQNYNMEKSKSIISIIFEYIYGYYIYNNSDSEHKKNIVCTYSLYINKKDIYILMERINKIYKTGMDYINKVNGIEYTFKDFFKIMYNLCNLLSYLQRKFKFIHSDINLRNFFIKENLDIILIDYGYSSLYIKIPETKYNQNKDSLIFNFYILLENKSIYNLIYDYQQPYGDKYDIMYLLNYIIVYYEAYNLQLPERLIDILKNNFLINGTFIDIIKRFSNVTFINNFNTMNNGDKLYFTLTTIRYKEQLEIYIEELKKLNNKNNRNMIFYIKFLNNFIPSEAAKIFSSRLNLR